MKAIVLTCDKYHTMTDHMIRKYADLWPDNPFVFRTPFQKFPAELDKRHQEKIKLIPTDPGIKQTVLTLLEDLDDDEWILWCLDDRYPIELYVDAITSTMNWIRHDPELDVDGVVFSNHSKFMCERNIFPKSHCIHDSSGVRYYRRKNYAMIWMHQFLRVKVIRHMFNSFPNEIPRAKQMDYFKDALKLPDDHRLYVHSKSNTIYGESTHRGKITLNCVESLRDMGIPLPDTFEIKPQRIVFPREHPFRNYYLYKRNILVNHVRRWLGIPVQGESRVD